MQELELAPQQRPVVKLHVDEPSQPEDSPAAMNTQEAEPSPAQHASSTVAAPTATISSLRSFLEGLMPAAAMALTSTAGPSPDTTASVSPTASQIDSSDKPAEASQTPVSGADVMRPVQLSISVVEDVIGEEHAADISEAGEEGGDAAPGGPQESAACAQRKQTLVSENRPVRVDL